MKTYLINPGHTYRRGDNTLATAGDTIELDPDVAAQFPGSVTLVEPAAETNPTPTEA